MKRTTRYRKQLALAAVRRRAREVGGFVVMDVKVNVEGEPAQRFKGPWIMTIDDKKSEATCAPLHDGLTKPVPDLGFFADRPVTLTVPIGTIGHCTREVMLRWSSPWVPL